MDQPSCDFSKEMGSYSLSYDVCGEGGGEKEGFGKSFYPKVVNRNLRSTARQAPRLGVDMYE